MLQSGISLARRAYSVAIPGSTSSCKEPTESQGNQQAALAQLERAQRIAPRDPMVYLQLARLRLHMGDRPRAEQLSQRGLSLAGGDPDLEAAFKALLNELGR